MRAVQALAAVVAVVAAGAAPATSSGATPNPPRPVIDQYIEQIPTAEGPSSPRGEEERQPLPADVRRQVEAEAGADAGALTAIATSPRYGAPQRPVTPAGERPESREEPAEEAAPNQDQQAAAPIESAEVPTLPRDTRLVALLLALTGSLVAAAAYAALRRRG